MRLLLNLLSFLALVLAPLATPAQAMAVSPDAHCAEMKGMGPHHGKSTMTDDGKCCVAVPAAIPPSSAASAAEVLTSAAMTSLPVQQLTTVDLEEHDPPPRS